MSYESSYGPQVEAYYGTTVGILEGKHPSWISLPLLWIHSILGLPSYSRVSRVQEPEFHERYNLLAQWSFCWRYGHNIDLSARSPTNTVCRARQHEGLLFSRLRSSSNSRE